MKTITRRLLPLAAVCLATPAVAQVRSAESSGTDVGKEAARMATNDPGGVNRRQTLEEVIVTAQKREERLIDTPISIGVLSGEALDSSSSRGITDVLNQVGGVVVTQIQPGSATISVRGVVPGAGTTTTAYYLDEVPFSFYRSSSLFDANAFDIARVEVLRGAQGTLYGANALAGVVRVLTNDANLTAYEAKFRARGSSTEGGGDNYGGDLAVNVPLIPGRLAVRGVVGYSDLSGYIDSRFDGQKRINDTQAQSYRFKVNYQISENMSSKFSFSRSKIDNGAPSSAGEDLTTVFSSNQPGEIVTDVYGLVTEYTWSGVSLLSSTGYIDYASDQRSEFLLGGVTPAPNLIDFRVKSFSQEFRLSSHGDGPWQWLVGAYYKDLTDLDSQDLRPILPFVFGLRHESESYAAFGDVTRSINGGRFEVTAGLRYFNERAVSIEEGDLFGRPLLPDRSAEFDRVTGRLVFAYKPQEDLTLYASVANAFRSGQIQGPASVRTAPNLVPAFIDPDTLITYEVGAKGLMLESTVTYDVALYYQDWDDIQQQVILPPIGLVARVNAGGASGVGADATLSYQPSPALTLQASLGWSDLKIDEEVFSRGVALFTRDSRINDSAEWTGSVGGSYRMAMPMPDVGLVLSTNFAYGSQRTNRFLVGAIVNQSESDELRILNASLGLEGKRWSLDIYGDNLLNDDSAITPRDPFLLNAAVRQRPRTIGLQVMFDY